MDQLTLYIPRSGTFRHKNARICALKIRNAVELCRLLKDTLNPQPVPVEEDIIDENSDPYQYRSKRMSKSPSNSILKGTSSEELSAYLNRFVLQLSEGNLSLLQCQSS